MKLETSEALTAAFAEEVARWKSEHPGWTDRQLIWAYSPYTLWKRAGEDGPLYRDYMRITGGLIDGTDIDPTRPFADDLNGG